MNKVEVTWLDAQDHAEKWVDAKDAEDFTDIDCKIISIGYIVKKTDKYITLAGDYDAIDNDYGRVTKIPVNMVRDIQELAYANPLQDPKRDL